MKLTGKNQSTRRETCPSATLSTTNPIWTDPGSNPGLRGETTYKVYFQPLHKAIVTFLHVSATYCSHHQGANIKT
jgi:hypothetical protein